MTQKALGLAVGVSAPLVTMWEKEIRPLSFGQIVELAKALNVSRDLFCAEDLDGLIDDAFADFFANPSPEMEGHVRRFQDSLEAKAA